jgi:hypothetical protein
MIGLVVLIAGVGGAFLFYSLRTRSPDLLNDPSMAGFDAPARRQLGELFGGMGELADDFFTGLKRPGTQAMIIAGVSILAAAACFFYGRLLDGDDRSPDDL